MSSTLIEHIKQVFSEHEPANDGTQWYIDDFSIDCDAEEFWSLLSAVLSNPINQKDAL